MAGSAHVPQSATGPILIIEDEEDFRTTYERLLRRRHHEVITVERGAEGLRVAESEHPCLVVTDLKLPDIDGVAVIRALHDRPEAPPIIAVSGMTTAATRRAALEAGAAAYLPKPFSAAQFIEAIDAALLH
ncbi:MAG TPA: response regulator [Methylomirabilota bacterium]|nr:response regulator [Methylomirabilota bacterium]